MNVFYYQGTKSAYRNLEKSSDGLYFCTDTKELFKGEDLFTEGLRLVENYDSLPTFDHAAEGKLYICEDTGCGYVLNSSGDDWINVIFGTDNESIEVNKDGLLAVKAVPISSVTGLEDRLSALESSSSMMPIATDKVAGKVKASKEILVSVDGTMSLGKVSQDKVEGLTDDLTKIKEDARNTTHYRGSVGKKSDLPKDAQLGDIYEIIGDPSYFMMYNGSNWVGSSGGGGSDPWGLKPISKADINTSQFEIDVDDTLNLIAVEANIVKYKEQNLEEVLDEVQESINWSDFNTAEGE